MTLLGKLFVMLNVATSFIMAVIAFGLYATNLDYDADTRGKGQPPAQITALKKQITDVVSTVGAVEGGWRAARGDLLLREDQRRVDQIWYAAELAKLHDAPAGVQVSMVALDKTGLAVLNAAGQPQLVPATDVAGKPLQSESAYRAQLEAARMENRDLLTQLQEQSNEDIRLTNLLTGTLDPFKKGLRQLIGEEKVKRAGVEEEYRSVRPLFINVAVESELIQKRIDAMHERVTELQAYLLKKHKVDVALRGR
jgi:hypothetical protein